MDNWAVDEYQFYIFRHVWIITRVVGLSHGMFGDKRTIDVKAASVTILKRHGAGILRDFINREMMNFVFFSVTTTTFKVCWSGERFSSRPQSASRGDGATWNPLWEVHSNPASGGAAYVQLVVNHVLACSVGVNQNYHHSESAEKRWNDMIDCYLLYFE